jgi:hypothetical protein
LNIPRPSPIAIAVLTAGLIIGGTGGAIAAGQIGTNQIQNNAITTPKLHNNAVTSAKVKNGSVTLADLAKSARGAQVVQYVAGGALIGTQATETVQLPGTWTANKLANSSWAVQLVRTGPPSVLFSLGQSAPAGEGTADGFYIVVDSGVAKVTVSTPDYGSIDTIRITRTISTSSANATASRTPSRNQHVTTR